MPFPQVGDYGPYADWSETATYNQNDIVFYRGYLYRLMTPTSSTGDNPVTSTFSCTFDDESGINGGGTASRTMRKWRLWDLPAGYYHAMLRGITPEVLTAEYASTNVPAFDYLYMIQVRACAKTGVGYYIDSRTPATVCSYLGYGLNSGLNCEYSDADLEAGELIYSFTAISMDRVDPQVEQSYEREEFFDERSLIWMPNTIAAWSEIPSDSYEVTSVTSASGFDATTLRSMHSSMQTFGRTFTWVDGLSPVTTESGTTVAFDDNWYNSTVDPNLGGQPCATSPDYATDV